MYIVVNYNDREEAPKTFDNGNELGEYLLSLKLNFKETMLQNTWDDGVKVFCDNGEFDYKAFPILKADRMVVVLSIQNDIETTHPVGVFQDVISAKRYRNEHFEDIVIDDTVIEVIPFYDTPAICGNCRFTKRYDSKNLPDVCCNHEDVPFSPVDSGIDIIERVPSWCPLNKVSE